MQDGVGRRLVVVVVFCGEEDDRHRAGRGFGGRGLQKLPRSGRRGDVIARRV